MRSWPLRSLAGHAAALCLPGGCVRAAGASGELGPHGGCKAAGDACGAAGEWAEEGLQSLGPKT